MGMKLVFFKYANVISLAIEREEEADVDVPPDRLSNGRRSRAAPAALKLLEDVDNDINEDFDECC